MADATFDGINLRIVLPPGQTDVDMEVDVYSAWKRWMLDDNENRRFPLAFRTVGGDPLTPGLDAGAYFFLQNNLGWRIRPPEENINVFLTGNLAPEDAAIDLVVPTLGTFTALIAGIQPITQSAADILLAQQDAAYEGAVVIDTINGVPGTEFPTGLFQQPSDNLADAVTIAGLIGAFEFKIVGSLTLTQALTGVVISGVTGEATDSVALNGQDVDDSAFRDIEVSGAGDGTSAITCTACRISMLSAVTGVFRECGFPDTLTLMAGTYVFAHCFSGVAGPSRPTFDIDGANCNVNLRAWAGGIQIDNFSHASALMTIDCLSAAPLLSASCTNGTVVVRGVGNLINNSVGTTVTKDGFVDGLDIKLIKALDAGNVTISGTDPFIIDVKDPDDGVTTIATFTVSSDGLVRTRTA